MKRITGAAAVLLLVLAPAAARAQGEAVRIVGEVRVRGEADRPAWLDSADAFSLLRTRLGVEARLAERARVFVQLQDARTFGEELNTADGAADRIDLHQAYLQYGRTAGDYVWSVRAGRQEIALGNERFVGAVNWSNTGRAFDAARITVGPASETWKLSALAATVRERGRRFTGAQPEADDHLFLAGVAESRHVELFALLDREDAYRGATGIDRTTLAARLLSPAIHGFSASVEGAYQLGNQLASAAAPAPVPQDIAAYMVGVRAAYAWPDATLRRVGIGLDVLSGDEDPADDRHRSFHTLYATNHKFYGYIDYFLDPAARTREAGLLDGMGSATFALAESVTLDVDAHGFWLQQPLAVSSERRIGWELDLTMPVRLGPGQQLHVGYSAFGNGPAAPLLGLGNDGGVSHWAYIQATFSFGVPGVPLM